ncbi:MAG: aldehyde dehydrogenase family protein [Dermatophilaceae bacterium]
MTHKVSSYIAGAWITPEDEGTPILDASTGEVIATASSTGLDFSAMVKHARDVGGPALRAMTFTQRGLALKNLAKYLKGRADEVYAEYGASGATVPDSRVDVEGGIGVLFVYAGKALKELPNDTIYIEGDPENIVDKHQGQTIYTSPRGVAVFINAYNFPVWGMLEKLATSILAGIPVVVKPATPTAQIAEISFRHIIESGILPEGAVQFVGGSIVGALDHLGGQDFILFTGSASTAARLRTSACIVERGTRFTAEADSVNATILGPDAGVETEEFTAFVKGIFREVTSKSGQKCTCIRRIFVPTELVEPTVEALTARLAKVVVGDPRIEGTTMGPLVSASQRDDVASAVRALMKGAEVRLGGPDVVPTVASGDVERGGFFPPTVLVAQDSPGSANPRGRGFRAGRHGYPLHLDRRPRRARLVGRGQPRGIRRQPRPPVGPLAHRADRSVPRSAAHPRPGECRHGTPPRRRPPAAHPRRAWSRRWRRGTRWAAQRLPHDAGDQPVGRPRDDGGHHPGVEPSRRGQGARRPPLPGLPR